jgi:adenylosuccinate synthase
MEVKVVTGANLGDEGKGLVSYCLANEAVEKGHKVLTVLFNGGAQRAHTAGGKIFHCTGTGALVGSDTFYHERFVLDPMTLWLTGESIIIDPDCRVVLPCDVMRNRAKEIARGENKHGSCGMGIFEAVKRSTNEEDAVYAGELLFPYRLYKKVRRIMEKYPCAPDDLYNLDNWMRAVAYVTSNCQFKGLFSLLPLYDTVIFEGGQGLLLDQSHIMETVHLTPSSVGSYNIAKFINFIGEPTDIYYVSRTYMTRHGAGEMEAECKREDINPDIVDKTNMPNPWQGDLRFGYLNQDTLAERVKEDFKAYNHANAHMVFTQLNYTNGMIATGTNVREQIKRPEFVKSIIGSDKEDFMKEILI